MSSFSLDFPDDEILDILGDDIEVFDNQGLNPVIIKGEFEHKYMENELGDSVGIQYPTIVVSNSEAHLFAKKIRVDYDGETYTVLNAVPHTEVGKTLVIMRS